MNPKELASKFSYLVNNFCFNPKKWAAATWNGENDTDRITFSALAVAWLQFLGVMDEIWTDARNHGSWELGHQLKGFIGDFPLLQYGVNADKFAEYMSREHRTLQQSFTRLCMEWFYLIKEKESSDQDESRFIQIAKVICENGTTPLPFI